MSRRVQSASSPAPIAKAGLHLGQVAREAGQRPGLTGRSGPLCFASRGFPLCVTTCNEAADRTRRERLHRVAGRPVC